MQIVSAHPMTSATNARPRAQSPATASGNAGQPVQFGCGSIQTPGPSNALDALQALFDAAKTGNVKTLITLLPKLTQLHQAGKIQLFDNQTPVNVILNKQLPLSDVKQEYFNKTLLDVAIDNEQVKAVKYLLKQGAEVNAENNAYPPLSRAVHTGNERIISELLHRHADPNTPDRDGVLPLTVALRNEKYNIAKLLQDAGAQDAPDHLGIRPTEHANNFRRMMGLEELKSDAV